MKERSNLSPSKYARPLFLLPSSPLTFGRAPSAVRPREQRWVSEQAHDACLRHPHAKIKERGRGGEAGRQRLTMEISGAARQCGETGTGITAALNPGVFQNTQ